MGKKRRTSSKYGALASAAASTAGNAFSAWKRAKNSSSTSSRFNYRGNGSKTKTRTKKKRGSYSGQQNFGGNISYYSHTHRASRRDKDFYKTHIKNENLQNNGDRLQDAFGKQAVSDVGFIKQADLLKMYAKAVTGIPAGQTTTSGRIYVQSVTVKMMFTNQAPANVELVLYDVVAKKDMAIGSTTPAAAWRVGMGELAGGATTNVNVVGIRPTDSKYFNDWWKIKKVTKQILANGESHEHYMTIKINKWLTWDYLNVNLIFKGLTTYCLVQATGFPDNDVTDKTIVSTASTAVDWIWSERDVYYYETQNNSILEKLDLLSAKLIVTESTMQEAVGPNANIKA